MSFLKSLFKKKEKPILSNQDFWDWFVEHEAEFFNAVKTGDHIHEYFFDQLSPKLNQLKSGFYFLTGMVDDNKAELVLTADGNIENIVFVEELVADGPKLNNWLFTALKPALDIKNVSIEMSGFKFNANNMWFYAEESNQYPDKIDIKIIHDDLTDENEDVVKNGCYIFLDNFLGELNFATTIDNLTVIFKNAAEKEFAPIEKLKSYLIWREKEFIEKYDGIRHNTDNDNYASLSATSSQGEPLMAIVNTDLMQWDAKASHPWIAMIQFTYNGGGNSGLPDDKTYELLNSIEDEILAQLKGRDGYLNLGRETGGNERTIYFACKDFRKPSKVLYHLKQNHRNAISMDYEIYKDKYWNSLAQFMPSY